MGERGVETLILLLWHDEQGGFISTDFNGRHWSYQSAGSSADAYGRLALQPMGRERMVASVPDFLTSLANAGKMPAPLEVGASGMSSSHSPKMSIKEGGRLALQLMGRKRMVASVPGFLTSLAKASKMPAPLEIRAHPLCPPANGARKDGCQRPRLSHFIGQCGQDARTP